jgi:hypothetical protein
VTKSPAYEAEWHINSLSELPKLLEKIKQ